MKNIKQILIGVLSAILVAESVWAAFPTALSGWSSGNTITSSWANALEAKIGADNSATTTSIDYLIKHAASKLGSIANITTTDGAFIVGDGSKFVGETGATARTSIGLAIGTDVQAYDAGLLSIAGLTTGADLMIYTTATDTYSTTTLSSFARTILDDANGAAVRTTIGAGTGSGDLLSTNNLSELTATSTARTNLGLAIGVNVQAYDAGLNSIAGLITDADQIIYTTALDTYATSSLSSFARTFLDDTTATAVRSTLNIAAGGDMLASNNLSELTATSTARTNLGVTIGSLVQAWDVFLDYISTLTDPGADRIMFWDDSATTTAWLAVSTGLTVTGTNLTADLGVAIDAGEITAAAIDGDDMNSNIAGRSLTLTAASPDTLDADAELYTDDKCLWFESPTATDDFSSIWRSNQAITFTKIWAESNQTVTFNLQEDTGSATSSVLSSSLAPAAGTASSTSFGDSDFAAGSMLNLIVDSVANTPTWVSICWTYTKND